MKVCVTGATGFIGRELIKELLARCESVHILTRRHVEAADLSKNLVVHQGDLCLESSETSLASFVDGADVLYHSAGQLKDEAQMHLLHVEGTRRLLRAASGRIRHWVQLSSVGAYGPVRDGKVTEASALNPVNSYERTKVESDTLVPRYAEAGQFSYAILRPSIVFGPTMTNQSLYQLIGMIARRMFFFVGPRGASANYIAVGNVVDALVRCGTLRAARGNIYNLSDHRTLETFVSEIASNLKVKPPRLRLPLKPVRTAARLLGRLPGFPLTEGRVDALVNSAVYDATLIERDLAYTHAITMESALAEMVQAWRERR